MWLLSFTQERENIPNCACARPVGWESVLRMPQAPLSDKDKEFLWCFGGQRGRRARGCLTQRRPQPGASPLGPGLAGRAPRPPSRLRALRAGLLVPYPGAGGRLAARPGELSRAQRRILRNNNRAGSAGPARPPRPPARPPHHVRLCAVPGGQRLLRAARLLRAGLQPHVPARLRQPEGLHRLPQPRGGGRGRREPRGVGLSLIHI